MSRTVMQQALDALDQSRKAASAEHVGMITEDAIEALRAELAKPDPVAVEREECARLADGIANLREAARNISPEFNVKFASGCAMDTARMIAVSIRLRAISDPA